MAVAFWASLIVAFIALIGTLINAYAVVRGARINGQSLMDAAREQGRLDSEARSQQWQHEAESRLEQQRLDDEAARQRQEREDRIRYHFERVRAYSQFMSATNKVVPWQRMHGLYGFAQKVGEAMRAAEWRGAWDELEVAFFQIEILGDDRVKETARNLRDGIYEILSRDHKLSDEERSTLTDKLVDEMHEFVVAARVELNVPGLQSLADNRETDPEGI